jgi:hypothetical protein
MRTRGVATQGGFIWISRRKNGRETKVEVAPLREHYLRPFQLESLIHALTAALDEAKRRK